MGGETCCSFGSMPYSLFSILSRPKDLHVITIDNQDVVIVNVKVWEFKPLGKLYELMVHKELSLIASRSCIRFKFSFE